MGLIFMYFFRENLVEKTSMPITIFSMYFCLVFIVLLLPKVAKAVIFAFSYSSWQVLSNFQLHLTALGLVDFFFFLNDFIHKKIKNITQSGTAVRSKNPIKSLNTVQSDQNHRLCPFSVLVYYISFKKLSKK